MNFLASFLAILFIAVLTGFIFFWAGIIGSLMIEYISNETVRFFTYAGVTLGILLGCLGVWLYERKKHGQG